MLTKIAKTVTLLGLALITLAFSAYVFPPVATALMHSTSSIGVGLMATCLMLGLAGLSIMYCGYCFMRNCAALTCCSMDLCCDDAGSRAVHNVDNCLTSVLGTLNCCQGGAADIESSVVYVDHGAQTQPQESGKLLEWLFSCCPQSKPAISARVNKSNTYEFGI